MAARGKEGPEGQTRVLAEIPPGCHTEETEKDAGEYAGATKTFQLASGNYYFSMESTNAKKGGSADYTVGVAQFDFRQQPASSLAMPETDMLAGVSADACLDSASDKLFGESGNGILASL